MGTNWLRAQASRTSRNRIVLCVLIVMATLAGLAAKTAYFREYFSGPAELDANELAQAASLQALPRRWVRVTVPRLEPTGMNEITVRKKHGVEVSRKVSASYHMAIVGSRLLLVKVSSGQDPGAELVGELRELEPGVADRLFKTSVVKSMVLPMELEVHSFRTTGHAMLALAFVVVAAAAWYAAMAFKRLQAPLSHPVLKRAIDWGQPETVEVAVRGDQAAGLHIAGWRLGDNYLVRSGPFVLDVHRLDDVLWAYREVIQKKVYGFVPAGKSHALVLKWQDATVKLPAKEAVVRQGLQALSARKPWLVFGWTKDIEAQYDKQRPAFATHVRQAREQWRSAHTPQAGPAPAAPADAVAA